MILQRCWEISEDLRYRPHKGRKHKQNHESMPATVGLSSSGETSELNPAVTGQL